MKKFISSPFIQGVLAFMAIFFTFYTYLDSRVYQIPAYLSGDSQLIASTPINRLKLYWDTIPLSNIKVVRVAVLNAGNTYIDKLNFSKSFPITIQSTGKVKILDAGIIKKSRDNIDFVIQGKDTLSSSVLELLIKGDDGLEGGDGALFEIIYTSEENVDWFVTGRVKNIPNGFINSGYSLIPQEAVESDKYTTLMLKITAFFTIALGIIGSFVVSRRLSSIYEANGDKFNSSDWIGFLLLLVCFALCFLGVMLFNILGVFSPITIPGWLK